tara:strand:+ start:2687 stop:2977 length:291 start_codon:yes stop_codon:yes gene_type:complete
MIDKGSRRNAIYDTVMRWEQTTDNHPFTTIDIINSGIISDVGLNGRIIPRGLNRSFSAINAGLSELERKGVLIQTREQGKGEIRQWRVISNGRAIA